VTKFRKYIYYLLLFDVILTLVATLRESSKPPIKKNKIKKIKNMIPYLPFVQPPIHPNIGHKFNQPCDPMKTDNHKDDQNETNIHINENKVDEGTVSIDIPVYDRSDEDIDIPVYKSP